MINKLEIFRKIHVKIKRVFFQVRNSIDFMQHTLRDFMNLIFFGVSAVL